MSQQGSNFESLEALRKHWSSRASSKRRQVEESSSHNTSVANGHATAEERDEVGISGPETAHSLEDRFGQIKLRGAQLEDNARSSEAEEGREAPATSDSEGERNPTGNVGEDSRLRGATAASRQPPSLSVMRPLGDFGAVLEQPAGAGSSSGNTPRASNSGQSKRRRPPASAGAAATTTWRQYQSTQQLSSGIAELGDQVIRAVGQDKEQAILKLYAVLCQTAWVAQPGLSEDWTASYLGLLDLGLSKFLKHTAALVLRRDKGYSDLVRSMAAAILRTVAKWMEGQLQSEDNPEALAAVKVALEAILLDGAPGVRGRSLGRDHALEGEALAGYGNLLDTDALEGLLDPETAPTTKRSSRRSAGQGVLTDTHMFGSLMDTGSLEALVSLNKGSLRPNNPLMGSQMLNSFGSALDTGDLTGHMMEHKGALRATIWLFKSDQQDAWSAAASLIGSIAMLGGSQIDAMGGPKLVKPLMWVLRNGEAQPKYAAMRALSLLSQDIACRTIMARQDKHLRAMVRVLQSNDDPSRHMAVTTLNMLLAHDPSTHWVLARSGIVASLVEIIKQPLGVPQAKAEATLGLKHLTSSSQRNRDALLQAKGLPYLIFLVKSGDADAQYNSARILRHLAMGGSSQGKAAACEAIPVLVHTLKVGRPRVCFACAAALAMVTEGHPGACDIIEREGGVAALVQLLIKGGGQGKKVAAEALQALAAESESIRPKIVAAGSVKPLVQMLQIGNLQQQAAAAGAIQALAFCPSSSASLAKFFADHGVVEPLAQILKTAPRAMQCAAAGSLCNLALGSPIIQAAIVEVGAVDALVALLSEAQPDGQYSAAAALMNLAPAGKEVRAQMLAAGALAHLVRMLSADSWYCRIVAADLIAHLGCDGPLERQMLAESGILQSLVHLLSLQHTRGTLEEVGGEVAHLAYERSQDVIVMKGYKFARAKVAAAAALGILAPLDPAAGDLAGSEVKVAEEFGDMLSTGRSQVRRISAAAIADLVRTSTVAKEGFLKAGIVPRLVSLLKIGASQGQKAKKLGTMAQPPTIEDAAAAAKALTELIRDNTKQAKEIVNLGGVAPLIVLLQKGNEQQAAQAAALLSYLTQVSTSAQKLVKQASAAEKIAKVAPGEAWWQEGATAQLLQHGMAQHLWGYAITAKPSANLYILLQVPFEALVPAVRIEEHNFGGRRSRTPDATGRSRIDRSQGAEVVKRGAQGTKEAIAGRRPAYDPPMQSVAETSPLELPPQKDVGSKRPGALEAPWSPSPDPRKSRSDILETWTES